MHMVSMHRVSPKRSPIASGLHIQRMRKRTPTLTKASLEESNIEHVDTVLGDLVDFKFEKSRSPAHFLEHGIDIVKVPTNNNKDVIIESAIPLDGMFGFERSVLLIYSM